MAKKSKEHFIKRAMEKHGNTYDYSKVTYIDSETPVEIICKEHGSFLQLPWVHYKSGCKKCGHRRIGEAVTKTRKRNASSYIDALVQKYPMYDYSESYVSGTNLVNIKCLDHGLISLNLAQHLYKKSFCKECSRKKSGKNRRLTQEQFQIAASTIHKNLYDYTDTVYKTAKDKIEVKCFVHGLFKIMADSHLRGHGCQKCSLQWKMQDEWLDSLNLPRDDEHRQVRLEVEGKIFIVDGYDANTNTVYEFWGDYWHGNPVRFKPDEINPHTKKFFGELLEQTKQKKIFLQTKYIVIDMWESEWKLLQK